MATDMTVANTIARQIGHRAFVMMGTRYKLGDERSLTFDVRGSRTVNKIRVTLNTGDLYDVDFLKVGRAPTYRVVLVDERTDIYFDALREVIERATGLRLSL
jgi:hypothetical protein